LVKKVEGVDVDGHLEVKLQQESLSDAAAAVASNRPHPATEKQSERAFSRKLLSTRAVACFALDFALTFPCGQTSTSSVAAKFEVDCTVPHALARSRAYWGNDRCVRLWFFDALAEGSSPLSRELGFAKTSPAGMRG
jgi:hypothetical protein